MTDFFRLRFWKGASRALIKQRMLDMALDRHANGRRVPVSVRMNYSVQKWKNDQG
jgi:hypothetical protein